MLNDTGTQGGFQPLKPRVTFFPAKESNQRIACPPDCARPAWIRHRGGHCQTSVVLCRVTYRFWLQRSVAMQFRRSCRIQSRACSWGGR